MAEVKWPARRISDGVLVDVTADTEGLPLVSPTENELTVGGAQTVRLLGPFHIAHDTPGIGSSEDGALLIELMGPLVVMHIGIDVTESFGASLSIYLGGEDYGAPADDFGPLVQLAANGSNGSGGAGYRIGPSVVAAGADPETDPVVSIGLGATFGRLTTAGALLAQLGGAASQGEADIYALIAEPA